MVAEYLVKGFAVLLVFLLVDVLAERLDGPYWIPALVGIHVVVYVLHDDAHELLVLSQGIDNLVHRLVYHLFLVQPHAQVGVELQLARHVLQYGLEERVYGLHAEIVVVVQQVCHGPCCLRADELRAGVQVVGYHIHIGL